MSIESRRPLRVGASYPFKIHEGRESVALHGAVTWCRLRRMIDIGGGESQALYRAGIVFSRTVDDFLPPVMSVDSPSRVGTEPTRPAGVIPVNDESELSGGLERVEREKRKRTQAGLADLVDAFIKDLPERS